MKVVGKGSQKKVDEILKYASIDRHEAATSAKPKLQPGPLWGWGAVDSQLVRQEDASKEPLREDDPEEFSFFKRVLDKKYSSPEQPTAWKRRSASTGSISSSTTAATAQSLSEQPPMLPDLCFDEAEQQLLSAAAKVTPLGLVKSQLQRANRAAQHAKTMKGNTNTAGGTKQGNAKEAMARTSKPASSAKVHTKSAKQVDQQSTKKRPAATRTAAENEEAPTECYEDCDADVTDDQEANMENDVGEEEEEEEEEDEEGGEEENIEDDEDCEPPVTRKELRHRATSSAYRAAKTTSKNNGDSPNTQGHKARAAYKKAAGKFDASH